MLGGFGDSPAAGTILVGVVDRAVLGQQLGFAVARIVRMREPEMDQERIGVLANSRVALGIPRRARRASAAGLRRATPLVASCRTANSLLAAS